MSLFHLPSILQQPEPDPATASAGGAVPAPSTPAPVPAPVTLPDPSLIVPAEVLEHMRAAVAKNPGGLESFATILYNDNKVARDKLRELTAKLPGEGTLVLSAADAASYQAMMDVLKGLDADPEKAIARFKSLPTAQKELDALKREKLLLRAAQSPTDPNRLDLNLQVLSEITSGTPLAIDGDGEKGIVVVTLADGKTKPLREWLESEKSAYMPALRTSSGTPAAPQSGLRAPTAKSAVTDFIKKRNEERDAAPNALRTKRVAPTTTT